MYNAKSYHRNRESSSPTITKPLISIYYDYRFKYLLIHTIENTKLWPDNCRTNETTIITTKGFFDPMGKNLDVKKTIIPKT